MRIENTVHRLSGRPKGPWLPFVAQGLMEQIGPDGYPLRFAITSIDNEGIRVEATVVRFERNERHAEKLLQPEILAPRVRSGQATPFVVVQVVPTGIRCALGGFAGDACPATNLLASAADWLVTHPNAVNASDLNEMASNVLYVEGKSLDDFLLGHLALDPVMANKVGTFVDPTGMKYLDDVVHTLHAAMASKGVDCGEYTVLEEELGVQVAWSDAGCAVGTIRAPDALLAGVEHLLDAGHQAIGGVSVIHGVTDEMFARHQRGEIPNPSGGVEAILTHLVSKLYRVPVAHAPLPYYRDHRPAATDEPRSAAEFISTPHYFSVLKGLHRAPRLVETAAETPSREAVSLENVGAVVVPATALGGVPALAAEWHGIPVLAVRDNTTVLRVDNAGMRMPNVIEVASYAEAAGMVLALRNGISPAALRRPLEPARRI